MRLLSFPLLALMLLTSCATPLSSIWVRYRVAEGAVPELHEVKLILEGIGFQCGEISLPHQAGRCSIYDVYPNVGSVGYVVKENDLIVKFNESITYVIGLQQPKYGSGFLDEFSVILETLKAEGADTVEFNQFFEPGNPDRPWIVVDIADFSIGMLNQKMP